MNENKDEINKDWEKKSNSEKRKALCPGLYEASVLYDGAERILFYVRHRIVSAFLLLLLLNI